MDCIVHGADGKESACIVEDLDLIFRLGRSHGERNGNLLQYSCLTIPWTEEPGELQFMGLQKVGHNLVTEHTLLSSFQQHFHLEYVLEILLI